MIRDTRHTLAALLAATGLLAPVCSTATGSPVEAAPGVFAVVEGTTISTQEFQSALANAVRQKYYHRQPQEEQLVLLRQEVADRLVNRVLLLKEAERRRIRSDDAKVRAQIAAYEDRYRDRPQWQESRAHILPALSQALREQSMISQLESAARATTPPSEAALKAYYTQHQDSFTEPERVRLSMILLKVDPSAPAAAWEKAAEKAHAIVAQLRKGADFRELARLSSDDSSAREGGDLGYRHRGMLPAGVEGEVDRMATGAISEPFRLLEGIAVFRLTERQPARLRSFEDVRRSVAELWAREQGDAQWKDLIVRLRARAEITFGGARASSRADEGVAPGARTAR